MTDEDLGIRAFQIKKAKAVERAIELMRHGLGQVGASLTADEIEELEWVLGELWAYVARADWDSLHFGRLTLRDIIKMLTLGSQLRRHARGDIEILHEVQAIVVAETPYRRRSRTRLEQHRRARTRAVGPHSEQQTAPNRIRRRFSCRRGGPHARRMRGYPAAAARFLLSIFFLTFFRRNRSSRARSSSVWRM